MALIEAANPSIWRRFSSSVKERGVGETARLAIALFIRRTILVPMDRRLDARLGTDTSGRIAPDQLGFQDALYSGYEATNGLSLSLFLRALRIQLHNYTFIDIGSGMGYSLCVASRFRFRRIIGVELSHHLCQRANRNVAAMIGSGQAACSDVKVLNLNGLDFIPPEGNCILFLFNPFGSEVLSKVIETFGQHSVCGRKVYIIYQNSKHRDTIERSSRFQLFRVRWPIRWVINLTTPAHWAIYQSTNP